MVTERALYGRRRRAAEAGLELSSTDVLTAGPGPGL